MTEQVGYVFISYSHHDFEMAKYINQGLRAAGIVTWFDHERLKPAAKFVREIEHAIENCGAFVVVMSKHARDSDWVENETLLALDRDRPIFTALIDDVRRPIYLMNIHYEDFRGDRDAALARLVEALQAAAFAAPQAAGAAAAVSLSLAGRLRPHFGADEFLAYLQQWPDGAAAAAVASELIAWARQHADAVDFRGSSVPVFHARVSVAGGEVPLFSVWAHSQRPTVEVPFQYLSAAPPFDQRERRLAALEQLNALLPEAERFAPDRADKRPGLALAGTLADSSQRAAFLALLAEMAAALRQADQAGAA